MRIAEANSLAVYLFFPGIRQKPTHLTCVELDYMNRPTNRKNRWEDHYARQARKEHYPARSVYKLKEIQAKFDLIRPGYRVLDLGCAPGSWLLYAAGLVGAEGSVVGIDRIPVTERLPGQVRVIEMDIFNLDDEAARALQPGFDVILSDMAPATTGNRGTDAARSLALCEQAFAIAGQLLKSGGSLACKIFQGGDFHSFTQEIRGAFLHQKNFKPQSCRKASKEIYIIGQGKK